MSEQVPAVGERRRRREEERRRLEAESAASALSATSAPSATSALSAASTASAASAPTGQIAVAGQGLSRKELRRRRMEEEQRAAAAAGVQAAPSTPDAQAPRNPTAEPQHFVRAAPSGDATGPDATGPVGPAPAAPVPSAPSVPSVPTPTAVERLRAAALRPEGADGSPAPVPSRRSRRRSDHEPGQRQEERVIRDDVPAPEGTTAPQSAQRSAAPVITPPAVTGGIRRLGADGGLTPVQAVPSVEAGSGQVTSSGEQPSGFGAGPAGTARPTTSADRPPVARVEPERAQALTPQARAAAIRAQAARAAAEREEAARLGVERAHASRAAQAASAGSAPAGTTAPTSGAAPTGQRGSSTPGGVLPAVPDPRRPDLTERAGASRPEAVAGLWERARRQSSPSAPDNPADGASPAPEVRAPRAGETFARIGLQQTSTTDAQPPSPVSPVSSVGRKPGAGPAAGHEAPAPGTRPSDRAHGSTLPGGSVPSSSAPSSSAPSFSSGSSGVSSASAHSVASAPSATSVTSAASVPSTTSAGSAASGFSAPSAPSAHRPPDTEAPLWGAVSDGPGRFIPSAPSAPDPAAAGATWAPLPEPPSSGSATGTAGPSESTAGREDGREEQSTRDAHVGPGLYSWTHMAVLVVVAFILGMLIFLLLTRDGGTSAGALAELSSLPVPSFGSVQPPSSSGVL